MELQLIVLAAVLGYLLGSLSFARIVGQMVDPSADVTRIVEEFPDGHTFESNSASATAARMALGTRWGVTTGLLDMAKVGVPALIWVLLYPDNPAYGLISGIAGHLGHVLPLYHRFVGGRGESAVYGVVLLLDPLGALVTTVAGAGVMPSGAKTVAGPPALPPLPPPVTSMRVTVAPARGARY